MCLLLVIPCPLFLAEMTSRRELQILQFNEKTIGQFSLYFHSLSSFFPFDLPLPTSQLSIIRSGFLAPGTNGFNHVVHADDRDVDYVFGGVEWLGEPVYLNPNTQKQTFGNQQKNTLHMMNVNNNKNMYFKIMLNFSKAIFIHGARQWRWSVLHTKFALVLITG